MTEFKLPELGENVHQGDLVRLMIQPGATVSEGQPVIELETDKAVVEVPSNVSGTVKDVLVKQGEKIKVGQVVFTLENGAGGVARPPSSPKENKSAAPTSPPVQPPAPRIPATPANEVSVPSESSPAAEFKLPELGENIHQGDLVRLMVSPGSQISAGQPVMADGQPATVTNQ